MKPFRRLITKAFFSSIMLSSYCISAIARGGGGGGHSSHSSGSSSGGGFSGGGYSGGGGGSFSFLVFIIIVIVVIYVIKKNANKGSTDNNRNQLSDNINEAVGGGILGNILGTVASLTNSNNNGGAPAGSKNFPEGLPSQKVTTAFMEIQEAWQQQDLSKVRKWISDGVYQRFTAQFEMMKKLTQRNYLSNIHIYDISVADIYTDGAYECTDIAITFSMDDKFICDKYPSLNESYYGDTDTEYWTFIKRKDAKASTADLYNSNNCPNCGASLENKLGEVSRCSSCGTLTNNAAYDWILSEITQDQDYEGRQSSLLSDTQLHELVKNDPLFSAQRMEDIASNVFMQIMEVLSGDSNKKLSRFAEKETADKILGIKEKNGLFVFDRLYLNDVTLSSYDTSNGNLNLHFDLGASFKRVQINGDNVRWIDRDFVDARFEMVLSKKLSALQVPPKEIAFSYECASCGAPYNDTTNDSCTYCGAPVVDLAQNWALISFIIH